MRILAHGAYIPNRRLERAAIAEALGGPPAPGTRAVASYDEDTTTMGVEAARNALANVPDDLAPQMVLFATTVPAYLDKTNAAAIHAALGLPDTVPAFDLVGSVRSGMAAMRLGASAPETVLVVRSDVRTGLPGSADERDGGDGAAAFLFAGDDVAEDDARVQTRSLGRASATIELLDRWRLPGERASHVWEERFGEHAYVPVARQTFADACKNAGVTPEELDYVIVSSPHARAARVVTKSLGVRPEAIVDSLSATVGYTGAAATGILLADVLDRAKPGERIGVLLIADGADALIFETTEGVGAIKPRRSVATQIEQGRGGLPYATFLTWREMLHREPPRRPDPVPPAAPPSLRSEEWKYAFTGSRCEVCGERHLPPTRVCARCGSVDRMVPERMADVPAKVATCTVDNLAFTPSPPLVAAVLDFEGGGRFRCEVTDVDPSAIKIGDAMEMTFRKVATAQGVHNYFWKAKPAP